MSDRATDQDLVPEQTDEMEKGTQDGEHERHANASDAPSPGIWPSSHGKQIEDS